MSALLPEALRARFFRLIEKGLSGRVLGVDDSAGSGFPPVIDAH